MQNDKIFSEIVSSLVKTKVDANLLLAELDILERSLYKTGSDDFETSLSNHVRAKTAYAIEKINPTDKKELIENLRKTVNSLNYVSLTVAFDPTLEIINRIHAWLRQNVGLDVAIHLTVEKSILGGAVIEYNGRIIKNTLITQVDKYFIENANL